MSKKLKRPRDTNQLGKLIVDIATGEADESSLDVNEAQQRGGRRGGKSRAKKLGPEQRSEIASIAASARWEKS